MVHVLAAAQLVDHVVHELDQLEGQIAHRHLGFLAEVDQIAVEAPARGAPLVLFDQRAAIQAEAHVLRVELVQLHDDGLRHGGDRNGVLDPRRHVADAELQRAERRMRPDVPPDLLAVVDAVQVDQQVDVAFVLAPRAEVIGHAGARETGGRSSCDTTSGRCRDPSRTASWSTAPAGAAGNSARRS